jgi:hypothetical protein
MKTQALITLVKWFLLMCTHSYVNCCQVDVYVFPQMDRLFLYMIIINIKINVPKVIHQFYLKQVLKW